MENNFWNDENVKEFCEYVGLKVGKNTDIREQIKYLQTDFKKSKQPYKGVGFEILKYELDGYVYCISEPLGFYYNHEKGNLKRDDEAKAKIKSVRRIEDNTTWTIGDKVLVVWGVENKKSCTPTITGFKIFQDTMMVLFESTPSVFLSSIQKVKESIPLLKTEDGVDYFQCDKRDLWRVFITNTSFDMWKPYKMGLPQFINSKEEKYFSTEDAAKEYILMNKPCLSVNDVIGIMGTEVTPKYGFEINLISKERITDLAKQKINK